MSRVGYFAALMLVLVTGAASAQHTEFAIHPADPPTGPLIAPPPDPSQWRVRVKGRLDLAREEREERRTKNAPSVGTAAVLSGEEERRPSPPGSERDVVEIYNAYADNIQWVETRARNGRVLRQFIVGKYLVYDNPYRDQVLVLSPQQAEEEGRSYQAGEIEGFDWISRRNYKGVTTYRGRECDVFQRTGGRDEVWSNDTFSREDELAGLGIVSESKDAVTESNTGRITATALIDRETRLPVLLEERGSVRIFEFLPTEEPITLPQRYVDALNRYLEYAQARERRYNIPQ